MVTFFVINNEDRFFFKNTYITGTPLFQTKALLLSICGKVVQSHSNPNELLLPIIFGWGGHQIRQAWCREIFNKQDESDGNRESVSGVTGLFVFMDIIPEKHDQQRSQDFQLSLQLMKWVIHSLSPYVRLYVHPQPFFNFKYARLKLTAYSLISFKCLIKLNVFDNQYS